MSFFLLLTGGVLYVHAGGQQHEETKRDYHTSSHIKHQNDHILLEKRRLNQNQTLQFSSSAHVCFLSSDNVQCAGYNYYGQLGQTESKSFNTPQILIFPSNISAKPIKIVTGFDHTCTLFDDGSVWCNGSNGFGQLGNGGTDNSSTPVQVNIGTGVTDIEAGPYHTCTIQDTNSALYCWGFNEGGQLGMNIIMDGSTDDKKVINMALSMSATCVVTQSDTATVTCVGINFNRSLNLGQAITKLTAGSTHFCALLLDASAKCWGANHRGQLGIGSAEFTSAYFDSPVNVLETSGTALSSITDINAGYSSTCLVVVGGQAKCFGDNLFYQLGIANGSDHVLYPTDVPVAFISGKTLVSIHVGEHTGHAVFNDDSIYSWGSNYGGSFGDGSVISSRNVIGDVSGIPAAQMTFATLSSSPSLSTFPSSSPITTISYLHNLVDSAYENIDVSGSNYASAFNTAKTWFIDEANHPALYLSGNSEPYPNKDYDGYLTDRFILALLYYQNCSTTGCQGFLSSTWVLSTDHCSWEGISCTGLSRVSKDGTETYIESRVTTIGLNSKNLSGELPYFNMSDLEYLYLDYNNGLTGTIPEFKFPNLIELKVHQCSFTAIPAFDDMPNLTLLQAGANQLTGAMPQFQLSSLDTLGINSCSFSSVPDLTTSCPNLQTFNIGNNKANLVVAQIMCDTFGAESFTVTSGYTKTCA